ncbi:hypothetical protein CDL12_20647 [Handroanthus impetiginosus]|uniref:Uncharacterized protein n=1 Tax=Handroanthus impetiginosus TaxID=429701 RepID=A0A2G9GNA7_9LAMI|nr:hypothetical protein CDL12_20647 [Handroanthus impetiginosus]
MESLLFRSGSGPFSFQTQITSTSPRPSVSLPLQDNAVSVFSGEKNGVSSPMISLHRETSRRRIRRSSSDSDVRRSEMRTLSKLGSRSFTALPIPEEERDERIDDRRGYAGDGSASGILWEEIGFPGGGMNSNGKSSGGGSGGHGSDADRNKIGAYYQEMLKSDPTNSLLLRNYGNYLHEVEGDLVKAEEYYGRAILASPGDGELLSLYGKLIWETQRDESRAKSYFTQAIHASPHDCMILGSYANLLWEAEEEQDGDEAQEDASPVAAMVEAF